MAAFSPRSPSPVPERSTSSFRSTDIKSVTKRALNTNSGIKTNSPSDCHQRSSAMRERSVSPSPRTSFEHKEDERDENRHFSKAARSGSLPSLSKGTKNFMAPTISAASKVAASPRKKVLSERNAIDHNDSPFSTSSPQIHERETFRRTTIDDPSRVVNVKKDLESEEPKILAPAFPNDASLPPYDPQVNFLSPRPEFLRYSPNPRLERYRRDDNCTKAAIKKQLESSFASESGLTAEELQENSGAELGFTAGLEGDYLNEESHSSGTGFTTGLQTDGDNEESRSSEIEASSELESQGGSLLSREAKSEKENQQGIESSYPESAAKLKAQQDVSEAQFGASKSCSKSYLNPKLINVVLVLAIASLCLPTIDSPMLFSSLMYYGNVSRPSFVSLVEENLYQETFSIADVAARNSYSEIEQVDNIKAEPVHIEDASVRKPVLDHQMSASIVADSIAATEFPQPEVIMATSEEQRLSELEVEGEMKQSNEVPLPQEEDIPVVESIESAAEVESSIPEITTTLESVKESAAPLGSSEESEMQASFTEDIDPTTSSGLPKEEAIEAASAAMNQLKQPILLWESSGIQVVLGVVLVALTIVAVTHGKTNNNLVYKMEYVKMKPTDTVQDNIEHQSVSELEMTGESCSVEMSSTTSEKTKRYPRPAGKETEEVIHKYERNRRTKRGSSVSNSEDSLSYGSFTIYEKLPTKQGSADEGTVTPVRRSSRIKKQTISS